MPTLARDGDVHVIDLGDGENRLHPDWMAEFTAHLDAIEAAEGPRALVTTATGKFYSNGLDLAWARDSGADFHLYTAAMRELMCRMVALGVPTVAAIQGHAFAGGALLALAHDVRLMRADRGFFCLPEVAIDVPFSTATAQLIRSRLPVRTAHEAMTTARRYSGPDALGAGIVDAVAAEDDLLPLAVERARHLAATAGPTLATIKRRMYAEVLADLRASDSS